MDHSSSSQDESVGLRGSSREGGEFDGEVPKLTTLDAFVFLQQVKDTFADNMMIHEQFLQAIKDFKAQRIDTNEVLSRVKALFGDHRELLVGFNVFLPEGYKIVVPFQDDAISTTAKFDDDFSDSQGSIP